MILKLYCTSESHRVLVKNSTSWAPLIEVLYLLSLEWTSRICCFFFKIFFLMWTISKVFIEYCFCFMFWVFGHEACGISAPRPGIEPIPPALEGEVLTTGPPGKSQESVFFSVHPHQTFSPGGPLSCTHTNLSQWGPVVCAAPTAWSAMSLSLSHPNKSVLQGALSWGQESDDFQLHCFYVFHFQAHIPCTSHFSPSHAPLCFVTELVRVYVFTQWDEDSLKTSPSYLQCFTLQQHLKYFIYWPPEYTYSV